MNNPLITRLGSEALGTLFFIFFAACALAAGATDLTAAAAWALALAVSVWVFSAGGGHLNPWVTVALALRGTLGWVAAVWHILAQLVGGFAGALLAWWLYSSNPDIAATAGAAATHTAAEGDQLLGALAAEALVTLVLLLVVFHLIGRGGWSYGLGYGLTYGLGVLAIGGLTGASLNFARTLGAELSLTIGDPDLADWGNIWVYLVGPAVGVVLAWLVQPLLTVPKQPAKS